MSNFDYTQDFFGYFVPSDAPFYVYLLLRPNGVPFYVGKGTGNRIDSHEAEARRGKCQCHKCRIIRKIWRSGDQIGKRIIFASRSEQEAFRVEALTIRRFRSRIVNIYDGDPRTQLPSRVRRLSRQEQEESRVKRLVQKMDRLESARRYTNLTDDMEERARLNKEIEAYDIAIWPPQQLKLDM